MMKGFFNRLLRIDLTARSFRYEELPDAVLRRTLGGKGLGSYLLARESPIGADALAPESVMVVAVGPATGTRLWSQSRFGVYAKSPATSGYGESYCGGTLAPRIKGCGIDAVILTGRAPALSFAIVTEEGVTFKTAEDQQGADAFAAEDALLAQSPEGAGAMVIGPAGENLVRFACIKSDHWRSLGRGGMGAVLGSKNLKGIAFAGARRCPIADEALLGQVIKDVAQKARTSPATKLYQTLGTPMQVAVTNSQNCFPTRYWQKGRHPQWEKLSADTMQQNFDVKACGCPTCFLRCTKLTTVRHGRHAGLTIEGPEYETIYALGGLNELDSLEEVVWLNELCDRLGLDTMSAGNIAGFAIEAYKAGRTDFAIDYNQPDRMAELFRLIAQGQGIGALFARGIREAARELDLEDLAVHVKGLEPAGFDPRVLKGMGLSYATSARGACHLRGTFYKAELSGQMPKEQIEGKARLMIDYEDRAALFDCLVLCRFYRDFIGWDELRRIIEATTGLRLDQAELEALANAITQATRAFNRREGLDEMADTLPRRFLKEATEEGARLSEEELAVMIREYNEIRQSRPMPAQAHP